MTIVFSLFQAAMGISCILLRTMFTYKKYTWEVVKLDPERIVNNVDRLQGTALLVFYLLIALNCWFEPDKVLRS
jgi:hypothetical protein